METAADAPAARRPRRSLRALVPYVLTVGAVWLGWQVALQPVLQRGPPGVAIKAAPGSALVLRRAAETELLAAETDPAGAAAHVELAAFLAREALARSPFDVRALRVIGLTEARSNRKNQADALLTLAGNWSLRDDPTHAWLVQNRLERGDYVSSFAHADTLIRRRDNLRPQVFRLFSTAAAQDPQRALPVVASLVAARPPWRQAYLDSLYTSREGLELAISLVQSLEAGGAPVSNAELSQFNYQLMDHGLVDAVGVVRSRLNRPPATTAVTNGDFDAPSAPEPFEWKFAQQAGVAAEVAEDDIRANDPALRIDHDGYASSRIAQQIVFLTPGRHRLTYEARSESAGVPARMNWTLTCMPGDLRILTAPAFPQPDRAWKPAALDFTVPVGCRSQWLSLDADAGDRRTPVVVWLDKVAITQVVSGSGHSSSG
jgi:hypothetical protein